MKAKTASVAGGGETYVKQEKEDMIMRMGTEKALKEISLGKPRHWHGYGQGK